MDNVISNGDTTLRNRKKAKATSNGHLKVQEGNQNEPPSEDTTDNTKKLDESSDEKLEKDESDTKLEVLGVDDLQQQFIVGFELDLMTLVLFFLAVTTRFYKLSEPKNVV